MNINFFLNYNLITTKKSMKIYLNSAKENWIVDRIRSEWYSFNRDISTRFANRADIIWIVSPWTWERINTKQLEKKKVLCSIYHIDEDKFGKKELKSFRIRDEYVNKYHVISEKTKNQIQHLTEKEIIVSPFWVNKDIFYEINEKDNLRSLFNIDKEAFLIGSFQRDTEGEDLVSPKLSKGPDRLIEIIKYYQETRHNVKVLLTGKRRAYLIDNLNKLQVPFYYFEMVSFEDLNKLYNSLDLYIVSSRFEGGPQAILECAITKTPIISTDVGVASEILSKESIFEMNTYQDAKPNKEIAFQKVQEFITPQGLKIFNEILREIYES